VAINYGESSEGFSDSLAKLRAQAAAKDTLIAKETERAKAEETSTRAANENTVARTRTASAANALVDTIGRSIEIVNAESEAVRANTTAWLANATARGSAIAASRGGSAGGVALPPGLAAKGTPLASTSVLPKGSPSGAAAAGASAAAGADLSAVAERNAASLETLGARQAEVNDLLNRSAAAYAASSNTLQQHGALTTEFIQGLARGEVTIKEFETQMVSTIGKFGGWAVAGGLVYGAFDAVKGIGAGISATQSGVEQLKRSLGEGVDENKAAAGFRRVAQEVNVSIREVADAQFYAARAFQNQDESLAVASIALKAYKLDNVDTQEAIKTFGALNVAFGLNASGVGEVFNILDVGQLKFNARLNQTLPQMGRAAASFHNAGGSAKELADQLIELNRATGGGGGTGGGNPATALIREPANLTKPATEQVLRQYGFDPRFAQNNVGAFNRQVQERAALKPGEKGALTDTDLRNLATAVGGGSALGLRYLLPLFEAGRTGLATAVPEATSKASGSAQEDLNHKLAQFDEEIHRLGVDFEVVGSKLASAGFGKGLSDVVNVLGLVLEGASLVVEPLVLVGETLNNLPGPLRLLVEGLLAVKGATAISRSGPGVTATAIGEQAGLSFLGGNSKDLLAVQATQREYIGRLQQLRGSAASASLNAGLRAQTAGSALAAFQAQAPAAGASDAEQLAYQQELANLNARFITTKDLQVAASEKLLAIEAELTAKTQLLNTLTDRKIAVEDRLAAASEAGVYSAQRGFPNTLPLVAPNQAAAEAEAARVGGAGTTTAAAAAASGAAATGSAARDVSTASAVISEESVAAAGSLSIVGSALTGAGSKIAALPGGLISTASRLGSFIGGLGVLGQALLAFVALEGIEKFSGESERFAQGSNAIAALESQPTTEADLISKVQQARKNTFKPQYASQTLGASLIATAEHPVREAGSFVHDLKAGFGLLGETSSEQYEKAQAQIAKRETQRKAGAFKNLGTSNTLGSSEVENYVASYESYLTGLLEGGKNAEKAGTALAKQNKLLTDQIKLFGTKGGQGQQPLQELGLSVGLQGARATVTQNPVGLDEYARFADEGLTAITTLVAEEVKRGEKTATTATARQALIAHARSTLSGYYANAYGKATANVNEELGDKRSELTDVTHQLSKAQPGSGQAKTIEANKSRIESEIKAREAALKSLAAASTTAAEKIEDQLQTSLSEVFAKESAEIKSKTKLGESQLGGASRAKEAVGLTGLEEELAAARKLKGPEGEDKVRELEAEVNNARNKKTTAGLDTVKRRAEKAKAEAGPGQTEQARSDLTAAETEAAYIDAHAKAFGPEEVEKAQTAILKAKRALAEAIRTEASQLGKLRTQIAEAEDVGNNLAQASDAEAGAIEAAARAVLPAEKLQAQLDLINAQNKSHKALQERVKAEGDLRASETTNPVLQGQIAVQTARKEVGLAKGPDERITAQTDLNKARQQASQTLVTTREAEIHFHEEMREISKQQAIQQYEELLKVQHLSTQTRDDLRSKIRSLQLAANNNQVYDLAPGSIKLPTAYDVRRAVTNATLSANPGHTLAVGGTQVTQNNTISINVKNAKDAARVGSEIERVTGASLRTRVRKAGLRGT
jgi:hypothetical protein